MLFKANYLNFTITKPLDQVQLFTVVSKLTNPPKKLIYDSYIHNHIILDGLSFNLIIMETNNTETKYEYPIVEPCFFELHFSNIIMTPKLWKKEYFPFTECVLELPALKLNLHKQMVFIINDYICNYIHPLGDPLAYISDLNHYNLTKTDIKQAKLRQMIFKRLLEDFSIQSKYKQTETIKICVNELSFKYSTTKIMQILQTSCHLCNVYIFKDENPNSLIPLFEIQRNLNDKLGSKNFFEIKAQLPLVVDLNSTYVPGKIS